MSMNCFGSTSIILKVGVITLIRLMASKMGFIKFSSFGDYIFSLAGVSMSFLYRLRLLSLRIHYFLIYESIIFFEAVYCFLNEFFSLLDRNMQTYSLSTSSAYFSSWICELWFDFMQASGTFGEYWSAPMCSIIIIEESCKQILVFGQDQIIKKWH